MLAFIAVDAMIVSTTLNSNHMTGKSSMVATPAPNFVVQDENQKPIRLAEFRGHIVILDLWASWCAPCRASLPYMAEIAKKYQSQGLVVLAVDVGDRPEVFRRWRTEHGRYSPLRFGTDTAAHQVSYLYHGSILPTVFVIDQSGKIVGKHTGFDGTEAPIMDILNNISGFRSTEGPDKNVH